MGKENNRTAFCPPVSALAEATTAFPKRGVSLTETIRPVLLNDTYRFIKRYVSFWERRAMYFQFSPALHPAFVPYLFPDYKILFNSLIRF